MKHAIATLACALALGQAIAGPSDSPHSAPVRLTESQRILAKVMDDIRRCDKSVRYEYDRRTRTLSPPALMKIKGLKLKKLYREMAVFEINEVHAGMRAVALSVGRPNTGHTWPAHSVAFREGFDVARSRLEHLWQLRFVDGLRPGPDVIYDGRYADITMTVEGKDRTLSIEQMPLDVYPHIGRPEVGCNHVEI